MVILNEPYLSSKRVIICDHPIIGRKWYSRFPSFHLGSLSGTSGVNTLLFATHVIHNYNSKTPIYRGYFISPEFFFTKFPKILIFSEKFNFLPGRRCR